MGQRAQNPCRAGPCQKKPCEKVQYMRESLEGRAQSTGFLVPLRGWEGHPKLVTGTEHHLTGHSLLEVSGSSYQFSIQRGQCYPWTSMLTELCAGKEGKNRTHEQQRTYITRGHKTETNSQQLSASGEVVESARITIMMAPEQHRTHAAGERTGTMTSQGTRKIVSIFVISPLYAARTYFI